MLRVSIILFVSLLFLGGLVSTKNPLPQTNEILAKILCHNICVLIQEIFLSKIDLDFDYYAKRYFAQPYD